MADHLSAAVAVDSLVEEREDDMHPPSGGNPTHRNAHFLKPIFHEQIHNHLLPPCSLFSSKPSFEKIGKYRMQSSKKNPSEKWKIWVDSLKPGYQEIWKQAGIYEAILASTYTIPKDKNLIIGLAERWCPETNTFVFTWGEVSVTLEDVIFLGNFSVLGSSFLTPLPDEYVHTLNYLKNAHKKCGQHTRGIVTASVWMKYFMCGGNQLEHEAFIAMWLSNFVFVCSYDHIAIRNFHVAIHLSRGKRIALAPPVLARIYRDMRLLHNSIVEYVVDSRFSICHGDLVHMWVWERFANLRPTPSVMEKGEPRSARWNGVQIMNVKDVRSALDSGKESFMWRPYSIGSNNCMLRKLCRDYEQWLVVDSDDTESFARCLIVSELIGLGCIEQYLPHRVAMQFGFDQDVPPFVIRSNQSTETAWSSYNRPIRGMNLYIPPRLFESDVSSRYMIWWRGLQGVNEETQTTCIQNEKHSPLVSCQHKSDEKSLTPPRCVEVRSEDYMKEDNIPIAQLKGRSRKTKNSGKRFDLENEPVLNTYCGVETFNLKESTASEVLQVKLKTSDAPGCPEFVKERQQDIGEEDSLTINAQLVSVKQRQEDIDEEDCLTIAQLLSRSINKGGFGKTGNNDGELVLNADLKEVAVVSEIWKCTNESMEMNNQCMSSSGKCKKSESYTEDPIDLEEDATVSKAHHHKVNKNNNIAFANDEDASKASCPEHNIVNIEKESSDKTTSELPELGLEDRIWRLEKIFDIIKAEKFVARSRET